MNSFLDLYFKRIKYTKTPRVDLQTLQDLHLLHLQHIPYENIDVFCHRAVKLDAESLTQKILLRERGGYCFEQNGLFLMVLTELGFKCHANLARVHRNRPQPGGPTSRALSNLPLSAKAASRPTLTCSNDRLLSDDVRNG